MTLAVVRPSRQPAILTRVTVAVPPTGRAGV